MKVVLFSTQWPEYMIELANSISRQCTAILVLPSNHRFSAAHRRLIHSDVTLEHYSVVFHKSITDNASMLISILRIVWKHRPDILHVQANGHRLFHWVYFFMPWGVKVVNTIHDPVKHSGDKASLSIDDSSAIFWGKIFTSKYIVHGIYLKKLLAAEYKVSENRIAVIPHGNFDIYKKFQRYEVIEDGNTVLFFGRIWKYKGLNLFIEAGNLVSEVYPAAKFLIVGKGEDVSEYKEQVRFRDNFEFINERVPMEDAGIYFQKSAVVVLPYIEATQSGVIPVAFSYGKPVVVTNVGSLPEVVKDGVTGFVVPSGSAKRIAEKILLLLTNPQLRKKMGAASHAYSKTDLSWESIAKRTLSVYSNVTS